MESFSDCESIRTEDFATKFCEYVAADTSKDSGFGCGKSDQCTTPTPKDEQYSNVKARLQPNHDFSSQTFENSQKRNESRMSPTKPMFKQTLDLESIATEMFDSQIQNFQDSQILSGRSVPTDSSTTSFSLGNLENVQPIRRDILNKFLSKYTLEEHKSEQPIKSRQMDDQQSHNDDFKRPNGKKEVNWKGSSNDDANFARRSLNSLFRSNSDLACDIRKKSMRIQNEIREERKRKLESVQEMNSRREQTPREQLDIKVKELDQLTDRMRKTRADREKISEEMDCLRNKLRTKSNELRSGQKWKYGRKLPDECDSYGPVSPSHLTQASQDQLTNLNAQLNEKKLHLKDLEERIRQRLCEIQDLESVGLSRQEIQQVIEERNGLYEILRISEDNENERYELAKQLTEAKEDLTLEHKRYREKILNLEEELDNSFQKVSVVYEEKERLSKELLHYKEIIQKQQDDASELYGERNELRRQVEKYKEEVDLERATCKEIVEQEKRRYECQLATEESQAKMIISDYKRQLSALQIENNNTIEKNVAMKSKMAQLEGEHQRLKNDLDLQEKDFKDRIERIMDEKNQTIEQFRKDFYNKKDNEIQTIRSELDSEQMRTIDSLKECYKQQNADLQTRLEIKSEEVQDLKMDLRRLKQDFAEKENSLKSHYETEIMRLKEGSNRDLEISEKRNHTEMDEDKEKYEGIIKRMKKEIEEERSASERLKTALEKSNKDFIQESELAKKLKIDKSTAIGKLKETAKEKLQEEQRNLKDFYEKELEDQLKIIEQKMQEKNSQIVAKSKEIKLLQTENMGIKNAFTSNMSVFFEAIHYQCSQMANEGKFIPPSFKNIKFNEDTDVHEVVQLIIKNFQICCQEYSQYFHELIEKVKEEKDKSMKSMEEKNSRDIRAIKEQMHKEQADEMNTLNAHHKQELGVFQQTHEAEIDRLRRNVKEWKQKTADRLAQKLQKEFRKEIEKKSHKRDSNKPTSLSLQSFKNETNQSSIKPIGLIEDLRSNIRQLRDDNLSLRKIIVGQNLANVSQFDEKRQMEYIGQNGINSRPHSVANENYKNRQSSTDDSIARSCSFRIPKE